MVVGKIFTFILPFAILTNLGGIWRNPSARPVKAIAGTAIPAFLSFTVGSCILAAVMEKIL